MGLKRGTVMVIAIAVASGTGALAAAAKKPSPNPSPTPVATPAAPAYFPATPTQLVYDAAGGGATARATVITDGKSVRVKTEAGAARETFVWDGTALWAIGTAGSIPIGDYKFDTPSSWILALLAPYAGGASQLQLTRDPAGLPQSASFKLKRSLTKRDDYAVAYTYGEGSMAQAVVTAKGAAAPAWTVKRASATRATVRAEDFAVPGRKQSGLVAALKKDDDASVSGTAGARGVGEEGDTGAAGPDDRAAVARMEKTTVTKAELETFMKEGKVGKHKP